MHPIFSTLALTLILNLCSSANSVGAGGTDGQTADKTEISDQGAGESINVYYNDEKADIAKIEAVLNKVKGIPDVRERLIAVTQEFIGTPYVGGTLNIPPKEQLYVSTTGLDCLTFVETAISLTEASGKENPRLDDYLKTLLNIRYRNGEIDGFPSRLHYLSEWALDNDRRGNIKEISGEFDRSEKRVKTLDFMTKHRQLYPPLVSDDVFKAIQKNESALKNLQYYIIPTAEVNNAAKSFLKSGDMVAIETNKPGLDASHVGIINIKNGIPYLIHASSKYKKVINDSNPLKDYLKRQGSPGIRVFRLP